MVIHAVVVPGWDTAGVSAAKLPSRWDGIEERLPRRLEDLHGPAEGRLTLPIGLCWSGLRSFDLDNRRHRLSAYRIVLTTGDKKDAERFLHPERLVTDWPYQRRLLGLHYRRAWESRFPELAAASNNDKR